MPGSSPAAAGRTGSCGWQPASPPGSPSTSTTPSADSTAPASASSSAPSAMPTGSVPPITPAPDNMTCVTFKSGNRHTTRHHQRESPAPGSARQNRYTDPLHTASADRRHTHATAMWEGGMRELTLQKRLGHASPESTRIYTRVSDAVVVAEYRRALGL